MEVLLFVILIKREIVNGSLRNSGQNLKDSSLSFKFSGTSNNIENGPHRQNNNHILKLNVW